MSRPPTQTRRAHEQDLEGFRTAVKRARANTKRTQERSEEIIRILDRLVILYTEEQHGVESEPPAPANGTTKKAKTNGKVARATA